MSDQSRVEAVARAIDQSGCWETYDDLMRAGGYFPSDSLLDRLEKSKQRAQAAIEANDAWLKGRGWKAVPRELTLRQYPTGFRDWSWLESWQVFWDTAPSPEESDQ